MKVQIEILEDQIELLNKIRSLPKIIEDILGKFPNAYERPDIEIDQIRGAILNLEFKCKKMIFDSCIVKEKLSEILQNTHLSLNDPDNEEHYYV